MAISSTTFEERIARIEGGKTVHSKQLKKAAGKPRSKRGGPLSFGFFVGVGILMGGSAYAWVSTQPDLTWVIALAG